MPASAKQQFSPFWTAAAAWLVPGAGYWLIGQRSRGLTIGLTIVALYLCGLLIGGARVVEAPDFFAPGGIIAHIMSRPWFIGQVFTGPLSILTSWMATAWNFPTTHARIQEIGTLYTAVAGMLNLLAMLDSAFRAGHREG